MEPTARAVHARGLALSASRGIVYPPTSFDADAAATTALLGPAGCGRTALLLTLSGRMRPTAGSARVCGYDVVREAASVRRAVALGVIEGVNDLDDALTVGQHLEEQALFRGWFRSIDVPGLLDRVELGSARNVRVGELRAEERMRLGIALALAREPRIVVIDDLDHDLSADSQAAVARLLHDIAQDGLTVLFTCADRRTAAHADAVITLSSTAEEAVHAIA